MPRFGNLDKIIIYVVYINPDLHFDMTLNIGEKLKILSRDGSETGEYFIVTVDNIDQATIYSGNPHSAFKFSSPIDSTLGYQKVNVGFNTVNENLELETENSRGGSRRSKTYKQSKKRSATHRRRSSKRMSRKMNKRRR